MKMSARKQKSILWLVVFTSVYLWCVWSVASLLQPIPRVRLETVEPLAFAGFSPSGKYVVTACGNMQGKSDVTVCQGPLCVWDSFSGKLVSVLPLEDKERENPTSIQAICYSKQEEIVVVVHSFAKELAVFRLPSDKVFEAGGAMKMEHCFALAPNGASIAFVISDQVKITRINRFQRIILNSDWTTIPNQGNHGLSPPLVVAHQQGSSVHFSENGKWLIRISTHINASDGKFTFPYELWNVAANSKVSSGLYPSGFRTDISRFGGEIKSPDGVERFPSAEERASIWNGSPKRGESGLEFDSRDKKLIAVCLGAWEMPKSPAGTVRHSVLRELFNLTGYDIEEGLLGIHRPRITIRSKSNGKPIAEMLGHYGLGFSIDDKTFVTQDDNYNIFFWDIPPRRNWPLAGALAILPAMVATALGFGLLAFVRAVFPWARRVAMKATSVATADREAQIESRHQA